MTIEDLLNKCEDAYWEKDYEKLMGLCEEVLKMDLNNQTAIGYKSLSYVFLGQPERAVEMLEEAIERHPDNYYMRNNLSMAYYDLGQYERSLECCDEGLKIKDFEWLVENRIKALIKLDRLDEAIEFYENSYNQPAIFDLMVEAGKCSEALKYCLDKDPGDFVKVVDKVKEKDASTAGDYYMSWISKIKDFSDITTCPKCGGKLLPIVRGYPSRRLRERAKRGEVFLASCIRPQKNTNYHCMKCASEFDLGCEGLQIECHDSVMRGYIEYKIRELNLALKGTSIVFIHSFDTLKGQLNGYDDEEFDAFIGRLQELGYLYQPRPGYVKLALDWNCAKEYLDDGKFAAPLWLAFPHFTAWTMGWRMGIGEDYAMNHPHHTKEYAELFPMPKFWQFRFSESPYKPHPPLGWFWSEDGKPMYPNSSDGIEVNDFIAFDDEGSFLCDTFHFLSIEHAEALSKHLYFEKYDRLDDDFANLELTGEDERTWDIYRYSVILNASYFKVMQDEELKRLLLETGDEPLIYVSDDKENLFGRALMEVRDEIRRICKNEDLIDWEYTEYLKHKPW